MAAILLTIAYDGTNYAGWQVQENALTVQECMMKAGSKFLPEGFTITTASRTDAGVHALGQRALLRAETAILPERILFALNHHLPEDIRVWQAEEVANDFHPRYDAKRKLYVYKVWNSKIAIPSYQRDFVSVSDKLDLQRMNRIAEKLVGIHDFDAFSSQKKAVKDTVREIYRCEVVEERNPYISPERGTAYHIYVEGNGFLYNMVRIIAGTILKWGQSNILPEEAEAKIEEAFLTGNREILPQTMPAKGLTLLKIMY